MVACITITVNHEVEVPPSVLVEALRYLKEFAEITTSDDRPMYVGKITKASLLAEEYEGARITIGFTPEDEAGVKDVYCRREYDPEDPYSISPDWRPVGEWSSGFSSRCTQVLWLKQDGTFHWSEP